jgi:hypothetical protein
MSAQQRTTKTALAAALGLLLGGGACAGKKRAPEADQGSAAAAVDAGAAGSTAAGDAAKAAPEASPKQKWRRESAPLQLDCDGAPAAKAGAKHPSGSPAVAAAEPAVRTLPRAELMQECQGHGSVEEACGCLAKAMTPSGGVASCEVTEPEAREREPKARSDRGRLVSVWSGSGERDTLDKGRTLVLLARRGATWSALLAVDSSDEVDRTETPQTSDLASVRRYEELPLGGGTLFWIQTASESSDVAAGDRFVQGSAGLTLCAVPADGADGAASCARLSLGEWDYDFSERDGASPRCQVRKASRYRVRLDERGEGEVILESGVDDQKLAGRFKL